VSTQQVKTPGSLLGRGRPLLVLAALAALPLIAFIPGVNANYWLHNFILVVMWTIIGMSWNLLSGYCGQVSFGHAAFFGIGAYTSGLLYAKFGLSAWWGMLASIPVVGAAALLVGVICGGRSSRSRPSRSA
jgi:branched-chain amino acid transport system permease protein